LLLCARSNGATKGNGRTKTWHWPDDESFTPLIDLGTHSAKGNIRESSQSIPINSSN
jgi:hypothetical protein